MYILTSGLQHGFENPSYKELSKYKQRSERLHADLQQTFEI